MINTQDRTHSLLFTRAADVGIGAIQGAGVGYAIALVFKILGYPMNWQQANNWASSSAVVWGVIDGMFGGMFTRKEQQRREIVKLHGLLCENNDIIRS